MSGRLLAISAFTVVFVCIIPSEVGGIWCFQCNSMIDPDCASLKPNQTRSLLYKQCPEELDDLHPFCRKISQKIHDRDGLLRVVRGCGWVRHPTRDCYTVSNVGHSEQVCQCFMDACNGAGHPGGASAVLRFVVVLLVVVLFSSPP